MKSKKKIISLSILLISVINILLSAFVFLDNGTKQVSINSRDEKSFLIQGLGENDVISTEFIANQNFLTGFRIAFIIDKNSTHDGYINIKIYDETGDLVSEDKKAIKSIFIEREMFAKISPQEQSGQKSYTATISVEDAGPGVNWAVWANEGDKVICSAQYEIKTRPFLWISLLFFAVVFTVFTLMFFDGEKNEKAS